jgi:hypothetical protein
MAMLALKLWASAGLALRSVVALVAQAPNPQRIRNFSGPMPCPYDELAADRKPDGTIALAAPQPMPDPVARIGERDPSGPPNHFNIPT